MWQRSAQSRGSRELQQLSAIERRAFPTSGVGHAIPREAAIKRLHHRDDTTEAARSWICQAAHVSACKEYTDRAGD